MRSPLIIGIIAVGIFLANNKTALGQEPNNAGAAKDGDACKVTAGPNNGKTGKYTDGATWCEGSWGATECKDQQGNSKCSPARTRPVFSPVQVTMLQGYLEATQPSAGPNALKAWEAKYKAKVVKRSARTVTISLPNKTMTFDGSAEGLAHLFKK